MPPDTATRVRIGAVAFAASGVLFVLYPAIRPFSDEASLEGAEAFASGEWVLAHMLAMVAFTLLPVGLLGLHSLLRTSGVERLAFWTVVLAMLGAGLVLPFYGSETFGLHTIGQEVVRQQSEDLMALVDVVRSGPELVMFGAGLLLLAVTGIVGAVVIWRSGRLPRWSSVPFGLGLVLYLPQFYFTQPVRVAHGALLAVGLLWIAAEMWRHARKEAPRP